MFNIQLILQNLIIGIVDGGLYAVIALGIKLLFGVSRVINLAHGELFAIGGFLAFFLTTRLDVSPLVGFLLTAAFTFPIGWIVNQTIIAPVRRRVETPLELFLIITLGLSIFLSSSLVAIFTSNPRRTPPIIEGQLSFFGLSISLQRILIFGISIVVIVVIFLFLNKTRMGIAIRATSQDRSSARIVGIDVEQLDGRVFGLSAALAAIAGFLVAPIFLIYPQMGEAWVVRGLVAVIMGGLGNPVGTLIASFFLAILEALTVTFFPSQYKLVVGLLIMVFVLYFRPAGILGRRIELEP